MTKLDVPVNTCVSANFTLDSNVHITNPGSCPGTGRSPYLAIYPSSDCTGEYNHPTWYDGWGHFGPGYCLSTAAWGQRVTPVENQWSILFRCGEPEPSELKKLEIGLPTPPPKEKPKAQPRPTTASISDSACYIPGLPGLQGAPRFIFKRTEADNCINITPKRRLKIYRNALCANGTEALFARYAGTNCRGSPVVLREVTEDLMATRYESSCIDMGGEEASSYTFWCTGEVHQKKVTEDLFGDDREGVTKLHFTNMKPGHISSDNSAAGAWRTGAFGIAVGVVAVVVGFLMS
jgi:hypothetical protein